MDEDKLPPGVQPYDPLNGLRVGALAGGLLGAIPTFFVGSPWFVFGGALVGGVAGVANQRRHRSNQSDRT